MVRAYMGCRRYDTEEELRVLDRLLKVITIRHNLFMPHMRLVTRKREGGKLIRLYEMNTPLNRVLGFWAVEASIKYKTKTCAIKKHPRLVRLSEEIEELSEELTYAYEKKLRRVNNVPSFVFKLIVLDLESHNADGF